MKPSNYREKNAMAYTRKEYMGGIPGSKIVRFTMGNTAMLVHPRVMRHLHDPISGGMIHRPNCLIV